MGIDADYRATSRPGRPGIKKGTKSKPIPGPKTQRRTQQERSAEARTRLLTAAIALICEIGYSRTTMAEIASRAGMTRGAIQHHFSSRDTLVLAILDALEQRILDAFEQVAPDHDISVEEKLDAVIDALGEVAVSDAYLAVLDIWVATRADRALALPVRSAIVRATRHYRALWERIFRDDLPSEVYEDALRIIVGMLRSMVISRIFEVTPRSNDLTIAICKDAARRRVAAASANDQIPVKPRKKTP